MSNTVTIQIERKELAAGRELDALVAERVLGKPFTRPESDRDVCGYRDGECLGACHFSTHVVSVDLVDQAIDRLGLQGEYIEALESMVNVGATGWQRVRWNILRATPEQKCKAALIAVTSQEVHHAS